MKLEELFPEKSPPPGGWSQLQSRIESSGRPRKRRRLALAALVAALPLCLWFLLPRAAPASEYRALFAQPDVDLVMLGLQPPETRPPVATHGPNSMLVPITADERVVVYQLVRTSPRSMDALNRE